MEVRSARHCLKIHTIKRTGTQIRPRDTALHENGANRDTVWGGHRSRQCDRRCVATPTTRRVSGTACSTSKVLFLPPPSSPQAPSLMGDPRLRERARDDAATAPFQRGEKSDPCFEKTGNAHRRRLRRRVCSARHPSHARCAAPRAPRPRRRGRRQARPASRRHRHSSRPGGAPMKNFWTRGCLVQHALTRLYHPSCTPRTQRNTNFPESSHSLSSLSRPGPSVLF